MEFILYDMLWQIAKTAPKTHSWLYWTGKLDNTWQLLGTFQECIKLNFIISIN